MPVKLTLMKQPRRKLSLLAFSSSDLPICAEYKFAHTSWVRLGNWENGKMVMGMW